MLYKATQNGDLLDILDDPQFVRETRCGRIVCCNEGSAQGVILSDDATIAHIADKSDFTEDYPTVTLTAIDREEFLDLAEMLGREVPPHIEDVAIYKTKLDDLTEAVLEMSEQVYV